MASAPWRRSPVVLSVVFLLAYGLAPLDYILSIIRAEHPKDADPELIQAREELHFEAAKAAAPYIHGNCRQ